MTADPFARMSKCYCRRCGLYIIKAGILVSMKMTLEKLARRRTNVYIPTLCSLRFQLRLSRQWHCSEARFDFRIALVAFIAITVPAKNDRWTAKGRLTSTCSRALVRCAAETWSKPVHRTTKHKDFRHTARKVVATSETQNPLTVVAM